MKCIYISLYQNTLLIQLVYKNISYHKNRKRDLSIILSPLETVMAIFSPIIVGIFAIVGVIVASKYRKLNQ